LDALALGFLRFHSNGVAVSTAFWGLWLFPFGLLVIRSGFFPRILGILLLVAGFAYLTSSVTSIVLPDYRQVVSRVMMPLYFGEVPIIFWLLIKGAKAPQPLAESSDVK
jgi:predicted transporter